MNPKAKKLNAAQVAVIRGLRRDFGWSLQRIADEYGLNKSTVWEICQRLSWKREAA